MNQTTIIIIIILSVIISIICVVLGLTIKKLKGKTNEIQQQLLQKKQETENLKVEKTKLSSILDTTKYELATINALKEKLEQEDKEKQQTIKELQEAQIDGIEYKHLNQELAALKPQYEAKKQEYEDSYNKFKAKLDETREQCQIDFDNQHKELMIKIQKSQDEKEAIENSKKLLTEELEALKKQLTDDQTEVNLLKHELNGIKEQHRLAIANNVPPKEAQEGGIIFNLLEDEKKLIQIFQEIKKNYPAIEKDIATIEWKKIWLPKFQQQLKKNGWDEKRGIYKLTLVSDPTRCYVGQAQNIKDRWYQHAKKMIGADASGNEELYKYHYSPSDFTWTLLEEIPSDDTLDDKEHYWINFYGCQEFGFNKRK